MSAVVSRRAAGGQSRPRRALAGQLRKYSRSKGLLRSRHLWCYHPSSMDSLPNIHDHSLLEYRVDLANRRITVITLPEEARSQPNAKPLLTVFEGREGHHFDRVSSG